MIIFKCDHCGAITEVVHKVDVHYRFEFQNAIEKEETKKCGDLCKKCFDKLMGFIQPTKKEGTK